MVDPSIGIGPFKANVPMIVWATSSGVGGGGGGGVSGSLGSGSAHPMMNIANRSVYNSDLYMNVSQMVYGFVVAVIVTEPLVSVKYIWVK